MRITNKIIQNNSVSNINNNKVMEDKLNTQLSTGKKITRPSDDPVVAIRALRLRTSLSEVDQYYTKNVPDAKSWLSITEDAVSTVISAVTDMYSDCTTGAEGFKTASDRDKILENLKGLRDEIYAVGNAEYTGRYVFTGYRTSTPLAYEKAETERTLITEQLDNSSLDKIKYVDTADLSSITTSNATSNTTTVIDVGNYEVKRMRLAYNNCDADVVPTISYYDPDGNLQTITATVVSERDSNAPQSTYLSQQDEAGLAATFIPETGELILSDGLYAALEGTKDDTSTYDVKESEIRVTYQKTEWAKNDLKPEHYFYCEKDADNAAGMLKYNEGYLTNSTDDTDKQAISYDVGFGQSVQVNTRADEVFTHDIVRDLDEMIAAMEKVISMEGTIGVIKNKIATTIDVDGLKQLNATLDAAKKTLTYLEDNMQKSFEQGITKTQGYLDKANTALTTIGNRAARVTLVENRLSSQQSNFQTLTSENEDADITEVAVQLSSVELSYEAALMATGKIAQTTLLNYL